MKIIPFGEVEENRFEEAKKYKLVEMVAGFWRLTQKCKDNYDPYSYLKYLQGKIERQDVQRIKVVKQKQQQNLEKHSQEKPQYESKNVLISQLLDL